MEVLFSLLIGGVVGYLLAWMTTPGLPLSKKDLRKCEEAAAQESIKNIELFHGLNCDGKAYTSEDIKNFALWYYEKIYSYLPPKNTNTEESRSHPITKAMLDEYLEESGLKSKIDEDFLNTIRDIGIKVSINNTMCRQPPKW